MKRFMLAMDDLASARRAADYLTPIAAKLPGSSIYLLTLMVDCPYTEEELAAQLIREGQTPEVHGADDHLEQLAQVKLQHREMQALLVAAGLNAEQVVSEIHPLQGTPADDLLAHAERLQCDTLVVTRAEDDSLRRFLVGSVSVDLVKQAANRTVWVVR